MQSSLREAAKAETQTWEEEHTRRLQEALTLSLFQPPTPLIRSVSQSDETIQSDEIDVTEVFGLISRHGGERLRLFGLEHGVKMLLRHPDGTPIRPKRASIACPEGYVGTSRRVSHWAEADRRVLLRLEGTRTALSVAVPVFQSEVCNDPEKFKDTCHARWDETAFVFVDNSNIFISAQFEGGGRA